MQDAPVTLSHQLLLWVLLLLIFTVCLFGQRCYRAGVFAMFGRYPATGMALARLTLAASLPALLCFVWFSLNPELSAWAWLGTGHLAIAWYGLRWLLPDGLNTPPNGAGPEPTGP